jgi:hypothetical protein
MGVGTKVESTAKGSYYVLTEQFIKVFGKKLNTTATEVYSIFLDANLRDSLKMMLKIMLS